VIDGAPPQEIRPSTPIWRQWNLISNFGQRDLKAKFKGTLLGWVWSLVVPLATLGIYSLIFSIVFRMEPPPFGNGREGIFAVWLFAGLALWSFFSNTINAGINGLLGSGGLLQKIYFPAYAPVLGAGLAVGIQSLIELGLLLVVLLVLGNIGFTWLLAPVLLALFVVFTSAIATAIAVLNVYYRDLAHLVNVALSLFFYLTPIIYTPSFVPESWNGIPLRAIVEFSPISEFITLFRALVYDLTPGDPGAWLAVVLWTGAALVWSTIVLRRRGGDLGEQI
jgi:ABC-type polysaccharide/polyol phosphate export permease